MSFEELVSIPREHFNEEAFREIVYAYCHATGISTPIAEMAGVVKQANQIAKQLSKGHRWCHFTLGSTISIRSRLVLIQTIDDNSNMFVSVVFETNSANDDGPFAIHMRESFYLRVQKYIDDITK